MRPLLPSDHEEPKNKQMRTMLYGDVSFNVWELEIIHTRCYQRLYDLKQLGWTDRVYPDAIHSRFNHSIGALEQADRIIRWALRNLQMDKENQKYNLLVQNIDVIRMVGLLHDVFHITFGHTLEDELHIFSHRHDEDTQRKIEMLDSIFAEIVYWLCKDQVGDNELAARFWSAFISEDQTNIKSFFDQICLFLDNKSAFESFVNNFIKASEVCLFMGNETVYEEGEHFWPWDQSFRQCLTHKLLNRTSPSFNPYTEYFIVDIIGNTISADLLDYALRDMECSGLKATYDGRILQYFTMITETKDFELLTNKEKIIKNMDRNRMALKIFKDRIRYDALSEIHQILNLRYLLTERVLFHRTKCAAGAMLGKCIELLQLSEEEKRSIYRMGDLSFLDFLENKATKANESASQSNEPNEIPGKEGALELIRRLRSRRFYKPIFHMKSILNLDPKDEQHPARKLSDLSIRNELERALEEKYGMRAGSVIVYCPGKTYLKEAECLVVLDSRGSFKKVKELSDTPGFESFGKEANNMAGKYECLWNLYVFVPEAITPLWHPLEKNLVELYDEKYKPAGGHKLVPDDDLREYLKKSTPRFDEIEDMYNKITRNFGSVTFENSVKTVTTDTQQLERFGSPRGTPFVDRLINALERTFKNRTKNIEDQGVD